MGDVMMLEREAHTIKGSSGNVGAVLLQDIAYKIEVAANNEDCIKAASFIPMLEKQFIIVKGIFHEDINS